MRSLHVHRVAEIADDSLRALTAGFAFVGVAALAMQQLFILNGHAAAANPVVAIARVNVVEIGQRGSPLLWIIVKNIRSVAGSIPMLVD